MSIFTLILITQNSLTGSNLPVSHPPNRGGRKNKDTYHLRKFHWQYWMKLPLILFSNTLAFFQNVANEMKF